MITQVYLVFIMTAIYNYIKDYVTKKIDYFEKKIDIKMVLISIFNKISLGTSLAIFAYINKKKILLQIRCK